MTTVPYSLSLGALTVVELNSPRVAPLPTPDSRIPDQLFSVAFGNVPSTQTILSD
ncbi:hypothetical protein BJP36_42250 [Moorena producens JHB]|uniref:Uncharacterized protein n=1 Tax=Moorena producens (strain JHB) TaxID=1454205 RepID=A0A9Q9SSU3_MOOP1|nr:hypothetical protein [Moorena producens]WAN68987.1 hypothetical protein BJP36_42250 [Moorena producens JHB]